jgi:hypothetical protein
MTREELIQQKKEAIRNEILQTKQVLIKASRIIRKKPRFIGKPVSKKDRAGAFGALFMASHLLMHRIKAIVSQPVPKFPQGSDAKNGLAVVGERGYEMIMKDGGCSIETGRIKSMSYIKKD